MDQGIALLAFFIGAGYALFIATKKGHIKFPFGRNSDSRKSLKGRAVTAIVFIICTAGIFFLFTVWAQIRVDRMLEGKSLGDRLYRVSADECNELKKRELIAPKTHCPYRRKINVLLIADPMK